MNGARARPSMRLIALRSVFLCTLALSSKVASTASAPSSSDTSDGDCASGQGVPLPPHVTHNGIAVTRPITEKVELEEGRSVSMRSLHDDPELQLTYVHGLVGEDEIADLVRLAEARQGWVRSPLKTQGAGELLESDHRNSSSCPMLWPLVYDSRREELAARNPLLIDELDLVSHLMHRVAALFSATGMEVSARHIEPLQLVRYAATERFGPHHDYHEYNADGKLGSSACRASSARSQSSCSGQLSAPTQAVRHTSHTWTCPWRRASATPSSGRTWEQTARPIPGRCMRADHRPRATASWLSTSGFATASSRRARRSRGSCERKARTTHWSPPVIERREGQ